MAYAASMRIGIDVSQVVYEGTGVARYVSEMVNHLLDIDRKNQYILVGYSWGRRNALKKYLSEIRQKYPLVKTLLIPIPVKIAENILNNIPLEVFTGSIDVFWSSDWIQPKLSRAQGVTTVHDLSPFLYPDEHSDIIVNIQKKRMNRVVRYCSTVLCDSRSTADDISKIFGVAQKMLHIVYPGVST